MAKAKSCPMCGGHVKKGTTMFAVDHGPGVFVLRHVPASVCGQCGETWFDDATSARIEKLLHEARGRQAAVEVIDLAA